MPPVERTPRSRAALLVEIADVVLRVAREVEPRGPHGPSGVVPLNGSEAAVMRWVHRHPGGTPAQGATATRLQRSNFSVAMRSLEDKAMIVREPDPGDARSVRLYPTDLALDSIARLHEFWAHTMSAALEAETSAGAQPIELDRLRTTLEVLCALDEGLPRAR
ncbi:putative transcriptional regulator, MarR family [Gordonia polyisoprenivorans VH2]|uniref:Winged helix-turn-helix transcriptional regulator n=2 Tax=Gordonia polyisoprenivorans TaxID=84595 RepID=A0A846WRI7_9ACTN|nr:MULTISPECIES: MarR family winged helix-turn-helix transcriptional regulator [Gordonia]AFA74178.1 putative transcriptional regulator, MarR family [Gordonia polyisoprenivorans VH2]MBE7193681.1 winged helix-turn-helix transcriptional regulator [Gordonia polyisoprenivorans]MDF3283776.1 MarR family winged helix-turn-helix transcriptional regulator [Gordonia sp. N1V]NKY03807.1 winged helix-turn-helix transcriptional regulator [Gordonia polyisoprenivorans]OPX14385.1 MarR family transcriptional reg